MKKLEKGYTIQDMIDYLEERNFQVFNSVGFDLFKILQKIHEDNGDNLLEDSDEFDKNNYNVYLSSYFFSDIKQAYGFRYTFNRRLSNYVYEMNKYFIIYIPKDKNKAITVEICFTPKVTYKFCYPLDIKKDNSCPNNWIYFRDEMVLKNTQRTISQVFHVICNYLEKYIIFSKEDLLTFMIVDNLHKNEKDMLNIFKDMVGANSKEYKSILEETAILDKYKYCEVYPLKEWIEDTKELRNIQSVQTLKNLVSPFHDYMYVEEKTN